MAQPGTQSPPLEQSNPLGETGQSAPGIPDKEQRGDSFGVKKAENIESGTVSDLGGAAEAAKETVHAYNSKTNLG